MDVSAKRLLNYIRCRRYASLNDPDVLEPSMDDLMDVSDLFNTFEQVFFERLNKAQKQVTLRYDFHRDIVLKENYHYLMEKDGVVTSYQLIPSTSSQFLKLTYGSKNHRYQMFTKHKAGHYELRTPSKEDEVHFEQRRKKLLTRTEDIGRIAYQDAFRRFLFQQVHRTKLLRQYIVLLNSDASYDGTRYTKDLFTIIDLEKLYNEYCPQINADLYRMINHIQLDDFTPCPLVKKECRKEDTFACKFVNFCFSHIPKTNAIFDYFQSHRGFLEPTKQGLVHHETYALVNEGMVAMTDVPIAWLSHENHLMQRYCVETNTMHVNQEKIMALLNTLHYPLIYLDFEANPCMLPKYAGEKPFTQSVFQYSIHIEHEEGILEKDGSNHFEFLADPSMDQRKALVHSMIQLLKPYPDASIIVYHKTFEATRLKELAEIFPAYKEDLASIQARLFDLKDVVSNNKRFYKALGYDALTQQRYNFYHPKLSGSYSLKRVIKIFDEMAYENLEIKHGVEAYMAYRSLDSLAPTERIRKTEALLAYCKQDTYSMFQILHGLKAYLPADFHMK